MAILTQRNHFMFRFMAGGAGDFAVLVLAGNQKVVSSIMAGGATGGRRII